MDIEFGMSRTEAKMYNYHDLLYLHVAMAMDPSCCESCIRKSLFMNTKGARSATDTVDRRKGLVARRKWLLLLIIE